MHRRSSYFTALLLFFVIPFVASCGIGPSVSSTSATPTTSGSGASRPIALVYRGVAGCDGCSEAVAALLQHSKWNFIVKYVGPNENLQLTAEVLKTATLYAQPGGDGDLDKVYKYMKADKALIQNFVRSGGRYLGFCMGGYLAGATPGFKLLPGDTDQFITTPGASVKTTKDTTTQVYWRNQLRTVYFQDGPYFILQQNAPNVTILARYTNNKIAALAAPYGKGMVGVVGPHPEATADWYSGYHLVAPPGLTNDLGQDLINTTMQ